MIIIAKYTGTYSCGHEGEVRLIGTHKDRKWKYENEFSKICPKCYREYLQKQREKENEIAAEKAKELELPILTGTEKQVAWANTIRQKFIDDATGDLKSTVISYIKWGGEVDNDMTKDELFEIRSWILENRTEARYWIDNREDNIKLIFDEKPNVLKTEEQILEEHNKREVEIESTVKPANSISTVAAEITFNAKIVKVEFEKNDTFITLVKSLGYSWNKKYWYRNIGIKAGKAEDRAAELGNKLLGAGIPIMIMDKDVLNSAINGTYEPECDRWILLRVSKNKFTIEFGERNDELYSKAMSLPGAYWDRGILVDPRHYREVKEFGELHGFNFSKGAIRTIEEFKEKQNKISTVVPTKGKEIQYKNGLEELLKNNNDILNDLLEED